MRNLLPIALFTLILSPLAAFAQQQFSTSEQAASALAEVLSQQNKAALSKVLGDNWQQFLPTDGIGPSAVDRFQRDQQVKRVIAQQGDNAWLDVGNEAWRLPVPIVKTSQGWRFDMATGEEKILTRAVGRNELSTIAAMYAYTGAQQDYYQLNHRWAQKIISSEGKKDGLYWPTSPDETPSPLGPVFNPTESGTDYHGYHFRIVAGRDDQDAALLARPVEWGETGVMSFMTDLHGTVYQANLGEESVAKTQAITHFAPDADADWQAVKP